MLDSEAISDSVSASSEDLLVITLVTLPHGAPVIIPISGNTKNSAASAASPASSGLNGCFSWSIPVVHVAYDDGGGMDPKLASTFWPSDPST